MLSQSYIDNLNLNFSQKPFGEPSSFSPLSFLALVTFGFLAFGSLATLGSLVIFLVAMLLQIPIHISRA